MFCGLCFAGQGFAAQNDVDSSAAWRNKTELGRIFEEAGVAGVFVVYDPEKNLYSGCNRERAETRFRPASTFKILNSLIAFETGVVKDTREILPYGGGPQPVKAWGRDMSIREAMAASSVPVYRGVARRIGLERMRDFVQRAGYGNAAIGNKVDDFWLEGPLAVSALEQVRFLEALLRRQLPFSGRSYDLLLEIMPREKTEQGGELFFKTGLTGRATPNIGWLVGWVRLEGRDYPFALNLDSAKDTDAGLRLPLARRALKLLDLY